MKRLTKTVLLVGLIVAAVCFAAGKVGAQQTPVIEKPIEKYVKSRAADMFARSYNIVEITRADIDGDGDADALVNYSLGDIDREATDRRTSSRGYQDVGEYLNEGCRSGACAFIAVFINKKEKLRYQTEMQAGYNGQLERSHIRITSVSDGIITLETVIEIISPQDKRVLKTSKTIKNYKFVNDKLKVLS